MVIHEIWRVKKINRALGFVHFHTLTAIKLLSIIIIVFTGIITQGQSLCNNDDGGIILTLDSVYRGTINLLNTLASYIQYRLPCGADGQVYSDCGCMWLPKFLVLIDYLWNFLTHGALFIRAKHMLPHTSLPNDKSPLQRFSMHK